MCTDGLFSEVKIEVSLLATIWLQAWKASETILAAG